MSGKCRKETSRETVMKVNAVIVSRRVKEIDR